MVRNRRTKKTITDVARIIFVKIDTEGRPVPHGKEHPLDRKLGAVMPD